MPPATSDGNRGGLEPRRPPLTCLPWFLTDESCILLKPTAYQAIAKCSDRSHCSDVRNLAWPEPILWISYLVLVVAFEGRRLVFAVAMGESVPSDESGFLLLAVVLQKPFPQWKPITSHVLWSFFLRFFVFGRDAATFSGGFGASTVSRV